ncbi:HNH endonuclease family protein [Sinosporangium siamense]|uniref:GmrSD restriction endonucleases C-terminal domain-containing protein n=1 Tax=Sinosporangium siamense TaxID=1367973 RepID=A0A919V4N8_9ACTN|nr:HNH endonuclease family protein [Sinosporangium siamense]GII89926.1 hypothetical protein Ssi02_01570 [Sinosporangium siamense]
MGGRGIRPAVGAVLLAVVTGCGAVSTSDDTGGGRQIADAAADIGTARRDLAKLQVKGRAPMTGFDREEFGRAWADVDGNGCDTRNDILKRDLTQETFGEGAKRCVVLSGTLDDAYSGREIEFRRGQRSSMDVQIDHVVALADAWQKGAHRWNEDKRREFANDPLNLQAVDGPLNGQKGAADAATWLPPHKPYRCAYVARQVAVKAKYELWVTSAEKEAIERVLVKCRD